MGLLITNGEFTAFCPPTGPFCPPYKKAGILFNPTQVVVKQENVGAVKLVNSAFWGPTAQIARVAGTGTVTFSQCHFDNWDFHKDQNNTVYHNGTAAIQQYGGTLVVSQSEFTMKKTTNAPLNHFYLGSASRKSIISENIVTGTLSVQNEGKGKTIIVNNADDS